MRMLAVRVALLVVSLAAVPAWGQHGPNLDGGVDGAPLEDPALAGAARSDDPDADVQDFPLDLADHAYAGGEAPVDDMVVEESELEQDQVVADSYDDGYDPQAYTQFQDALAPYGTWAEDPAYGMVWQPSPEVVGADFAPYYTNGYWDMTEYGWTWVSGYDWGWAPFHYGRWVVIGGRGWSWIPGTIWGPSWVSWRSGGGYVGWAPMPPRGVHVPGYEWRGSPWRFVPAHQLGGRRTYDCVPPERVRGVWRGSRVVAHQKTLRRGHSHVHVHPGPIREVRRKPARLGAIAPHALPKKQVLPRPGQTVGARPWVRHAIANPPRKPSLVTGRPGALPPRGGQPGWTGGGLPSGFGRGMPIPPASRPMTRPIGPIGSISRPFPSTPSGGFAPPPTGTNPGFRVGPPPSRVLPRITPQPPPRTFGSGQPSFHARPPSFGTPFDQPRPGFGAPSPIQPPRPTFAAPAARLPSPRPAFQPPPQFQAPRPVFQPTPQFQAPRPSFQVPPPSFQQPRPVFQAAPRPHFQRPAPPTPVSNGGFGARPAMPAGGGFGARAPAPGGGGFGAGARPGGGWRGGR